MKSQANWFAGQLRKIVSALPSDQLPRLVCSHQTRPFFAERREHTSAFIKDLDAQFPLWRINVDEQM